MKEVFSKILLISGLLYSHISVGCNDYVIQKPNPFMGNHGEVFVLDDGSIWEVQYSYEYLYEYYPSVILCEDRGLLIVGDSKIDVTKVSGGSSSGSSDYVESQVDGTWEGWNGDTIVRLMNGQVWEQSGLELSLSLKLNPDVTILKKGGRFYMLVEGEDKPVWVTRLR